MTLSDYLPTSVVFEDDPVESDPDPEFGFASLTWDRLFDLLDGPSYNYLYNRPSEPPDPIGGTEPVEVWRIQHPVNGIGPYNANNSFELSREQAHALYDALDRVHSEDDDHLPPQAFGLDLDGWETPERVCGAPSFEALATWFDHGALDELVAEAGFEVKHYSVAPDHVWDLGTQVVFDRDYAQEL